MAKFIGRQKVLGVGRETTRGTLVAPSFWVPKTSYTHEDKVVKAMTESSYGRIYPGDDAFVAQQWAEGDIEMEVQDIPIALFFYALFGGLSSASFNSAYKHTLSIPQNVQHTTLSLHMNDAINAASGNNLTVAYAMAMINTFNMSVELGEVVKCVCNLMSKSHTDYTKQTESQTAYNKFSHNHLVFKVANTEAGLDAAAKINLQSLSLDINKNVVRENSLGTVQAVDILNRKVMISGTIRLTYEDRTYRDYMLDGTKKAIRIALVNEDVTIGSTNPQVQIDIPIAHFHSWEPEDVQDEIATEEITFEALYDVSNDQLVGANTFVVNNQASY